jgi:hypothetical protein
LCQQSFLLDFPDGTRKLVARLRLLANDGQVSYFVGGETYFRHPIGVSDSNRPPWEDGARASAGGGKGAN